MAALWWPHLLRFETSQSKIFVHPCVKRLRQKTEKTELLCSMMWSIQDREMPTEPYEKMPSTMPYLFCEASQSCVSLRAQPSVRRERLLKRSCVQTQDAEVEKAPKRNVFEQNKCLVLND